MNYYKDLRRFFVRRLIGENDDVRIIHLSEFYVDISFVLITSGLFVLPVIFLNYSFLVGGVVLSSVIIAFLALAFLSHRAGQIFGLFNFFVVIFLINFLWGGWHSPAFVWFAVIPIFAIAVAGKKPGAICIFLSIVFVMFFYVADYYQIHFINELNPKLYRLSHGIMNICAVAALSALAYIYELFKDKMFDIYESSQKDLKKSKDLFWAILDNSPAAIHIKDLDGRYILVNRQYEKNFHISCKDIEGKTSFDIHPVVLAEKVRLNDLEVQKRRMANIYEEMVIQDDELHSYFSVKFPLIDEGDNLYAICGISTDITEIKKMQEEKEIVQNQLFQSSRLASLGEMAGGVAHEINNPLAVIAGTSRRIRRVVNSDNVSVDKIKSYLDDIDLVTDRVSKIIDGLRTFSRDGVTDHFTKIRLDKVIDSALALTLEKFKGKNINVKIDMPADRESLMVVCNEVQIGQVIINLLNNAYDAVVELEKKWIAIEVRDLSDQVHIIITDSGTGIPLSIRDKLMHPFFTTKGVGRGTGLGLSISRGIIENHGGMLELDNDSSNTSFVVVLPKESL